MNTRSRPECGGRGPPGGLLALVGLLGLIGPAIVSAGENAATRAPCGVEQAIVGTAACADPTLIRLETELDAAYERARERVGVEPALVEALRGEQAMFAEGRAAVAALPGASLAAYLASWRSWLDAIGQPRPGWDGIWLTGAGSLEIAPRGDGVYRIVVHADEPTRGAYTCAFIGIGRLGGDAIEVEWDAADGDDGADGWTLTIRRAEDLMHVEQHRGGSEAVTPPFCGHHGSLDGHYLPALVKPGSVTAWGPAPTTP
jgi:hypothetical protein